MFHVASNPSFVVLALTIAFVFGTNQHLICKTVDDVFTDGSAVSNTFTTRRVLQGPSGKRGQNGVKGEPGIPGIKGETGLPGLVDQENVENVIEEKLRQANRELLGRVEELERVVSKMNPSITDFPAMIHCEDGFLHHAKCYFAIMQNANYETARRLCVAKGGAMADILSRRHQDLVVNYIRSNTTAQKLIWLGMSYTPSTSTLRWSDGNKVPEDVAGEMRWWTEGGYPTSGSSYDTVGILVNQNTFGLVNWHSTFTGRGVLCEE